MRNNFLNLLEHLKFIHNPLSSNCISSLISALSILSFYNYLKNIDFIFCKNNCSKDFLVPVEKINVIANMTTFYFSATLLTNLLIEAKLFKTDDRDETNATLNYNFFKDLLTKKNLKHTLKSLSPAALGIIPGLVFIYFNNKDANLDDILIFTSTFVIKHSYQNHKLNKSTSRENHRIMRVPTAIIIPMQTPYILNSIPVNHHTQINTNAIYTPAIPIQNQPRNMIEINSSLANTDSRSPSPRSSLSITTSQIQILS